MMETEEQRIGKRQVLFCFPSFYFPRLKETTKYVRDFLGSLFVAAFLGKETSRSRDQLAALPCV
jgi:hypothetical protein